jgi:hypothetical protein
VRFAGNSTIARRYFFNTNMSDTALLKNYLQQYFVDKPTFAGIIGISAERLDQLITAEAISRPSYVCGNGVITSHAFGDIAIDDSCIGEFFRPECVRWALIATAAAHGAGQSAVLAVLRHELFQALQNLQLDGETPQSADELVQSFIPSFWNGTFGLCVADPASGAGIVRKEMLQQRLTRLSENGSNPRPTGISPVVFSQLIDDYAASCMPFSPAEFARSSRKRMVDDLRVLIARAELAL